MGMRNAQQQQQHASKVGPQRLEVDMEVQIASKIDEIHKASRESGIDADNDERRSRCAGKLGTIVDTDPRDQSVKVRVMVLPGRADEVWFGAGAVEPLPERDSGFAHEGPRHYASGA